MGQWVRAQGQVKVAKNLKTCPHFDITSRKHQTKNEKRFFSISTRRLAESVEGLNSSLALAAGNFWPRKGPPITAVKGLRLHGFSVQRTMNWKLKCCYLEVATEPSMDLLISKLIRPYRLTWRSSNKAVTFSLNWHWSGSLTDRFQVCCANCWGFTSWLGALRFRKWMLAHFNLWDQFFFTFFKTFPLGVSVRLVSG